MKNVVAAAQTGCDCATLVSGGNFSFHTAAAGGGPSHQPHTSLPHSNSSGADDFDDGAAAAAACFLQLQRLVFEANRRLWLEWRQRPDYELTADVYSVAILCLFASIIALLMVRAVKPSESLDEQVTILLNSMRVRVESENDARQRQKLRDAKLKAQRWLAEAARVRRAAGGGIATRLSFRRSNDISSVVNASITPRDDECVVPLTPTTPTTIITTTPSLVAAAAIRCHSSSSTAATGGGSGYAYDHHFSRKSSTRSAAPWLSGSSGADDGSCRRGTLSSGAASGVSIRPPHSTQSARTTNASFTTHLSVRAHTSSSSPSSSVPTGSASTHQRQQPQLQHPHLLQVSGKRSVSSQHLLPATRAGDANSGGGGDTARRGFVRNLRTRSYTCLPAIVVTYKSDEEQPVEEEEEAQRTTLELFVDDSDDTGGVEDSPRHSSTSTSRPLSRVSSDCSSLSSASVTVFMDDEEV